MKRPSLCCLLLLALLIAACDREPRPATVDTTADTLSAVSDSSTAAGSRSGWAPGLGPLLLVAGDQHEASAVFPGFSDSTLTDTTTFDTSILAGLDVDLFSRSGLAGRGRLRAVPARLRDDGCVAWPEAAVTITDSLESHAGWTVAFASGRARPLLLDSLESLTGADSARLTAEVSRLASTVPNDTAMAFQGIPYFVRQVRRFRIPPGTEVLIANVTRRINQEANPREEQLLLIGERPLNEPDGRYALHYHERVSGAEEAIESSDVLAAVALVSGGAPAIVLIRDYGDGSAYALLVRDPNGQWRLAWNSAYAGC
jgi:hypothetical protein